MDNIKRDRRRIDNPLEQDFAEQAVQLENDEILEEIETEIHRELVQIDKSLLRLKQGDYGICSHCTRSIDIERLNALPHTDLCIQCAQ